MTIDIDSAHNSTVERASKSTAGKLSHSQFYALHLANHYKLTRKSMGWRTENHPRWGVTAPVQILSPRTIESLWWMGLLDGTPDAVIQPGVDAGTPEQWTNERGTLLLGQIQAEARGYFDMTTDKLTYPEFDAVGSTSLAIH